ncbi:MAG: DUF3047 domain-containing protein [Rhodospirillales bacterium]|nr:DUF3047 domain-containing protein [Rhodospirillales bacterium]MBO6788579.1 DUF3047 domain-containing protein [Rhodospirillales bacterium]
MMRIPPLFCVLAAFGLAVPAPHDAHAAGTVPIRPDLAGAGWQMLSFSGIPETTFTASDDGVMDVTADRSSSVLYLKIADDPQPVRRLSWQWRVADPLPATDLSKTDGDDRMLSLYVAFSDGSLVSKAKAMMSPLAAGNVINYVWGGTRALDMPHPHFPDSGRLIVIRTADAPLGQWITESVDLAADYERAFGRPAPGVAYIGISGDADDLGRVSKASIRDIRFDCIEVRVACAGNQP